MDIVWMAAIAALWVAAAEMVVGLNRLDRPKRTVDEHADEQRAGGRS
jgi:hypothetical protein